MRLFKKREYKSGSHFALWRWTYTPSGYITRLHIFKTPWFAVCLHFLNEPDPEPYLHDHPVTFLSLILRGGYTEFRWFADWYSACEKQHGIDRPRVKVRRWWNWIWATDQDRHCIIHVKPGTVTLALMGPKTRDWGFHTEDGWIGWKEYNDRKYKAVQS